MEKQLRQRYFRDDALTPFIEKIINWSEVEEFVRPSKENEKKTVEQYVVLSDKRIMERIEIGDHKENPRIRVTKDGRVLEVHVKVISIAEALRRLDKRAVERKKAEHL